MKPSAKRYFVVMGTVPFIGAAALFAAGFVYGVLRQVPTDLKVPGPAVN